MLYWLRVEEGSRLKTSGNEDEMPVTCPRKSKPVIIWKAPKKKRSFSNEEDEVTEEQIIGAVKQLEAGRPVKELARELGVTDQTLYNWKSKYGGMEVSEAKRLKALEDENRRLKEMVADLSLDKEALKAVIRKNGWSL